MNQLISAIFWTIVYHYSYNISIYKEVNILITGNNSKSLGYTMASPEAEIHLPKGAQEHFYQEKWRRRGSPFVYLLFYLINSLGKDMNLSKQRTEFKNVKGCWGTQLSADEDIHYKWLIIELFNINKDMCQDVSKWDLLQIFYGTKVSYSLIPNLQPFSNLYIVTEVRCGSLTGEEAVADPLVQ